MISYSQLVSQIWPVYPNVTIVRGDLLHPVVSGNKLFKLIPLLNKAKREDKSVLLSVGGRYSNHLHALAWAGHESAMQTVGLVRGYEAQPLTPTLVDCQKWGMHIHFISHDEYESRYSDDFWTFWLRRYEHSLRIDEGGWSAEAIQGSALWWQGIDPKTTLVVCAIGSGSTYAGLVLSKPKQVKVVGVPVFRDPDNYQNLVRKLTDVGVAMGDIHLWPEGAGRGFGKLNAQQRAFKDVFEKQNNCELDPVYTTKVFHALALRLNSDDSLQKHQISVIHTGGLQGNRN